MSVLYTRDLQPVQCLPQTFDIEDLPKSPPPLEINFLFIRWMMVLFLIFQVNVKSIKTLLDINDGCIVGYKVILIKNGLFGTVKA